MAAVEPLLDRGVLLIKGPGQDRIESFQTVARADGGYTFLSGIAAMDGTYGAEGRWDYDADHHAIRATGTCKIGDQQRTASCTRVGDHLALVSLTNGSEQREHIPFSDQLLDMEPGALPLSVMARRYDRRVGGRQTFRWAGVSLIRDVMLTEGEAHIRHLGTADVIRADGSSLGIEAWSFDEEIPGAPIFRFLMWTDLNGGLRRFTVALGDNPASTVGIRQGDEDIAERLVSPAGPGL